MEIIQWVMTGNETGCADIPYKTKYQPGPDILKISKLSLKITLKITICLPVKCFQLLLGGDARISVRVVIGYGMLGH